MITVLFFAKLREDVQCAQLHISADNIRTVTDLVLKLGVEKGELMQQALLAHNVLVAINHELSEFASIVQDSDEVAFFPPVSGG
jgi:molybdopterin synthase sulfur carrier subunit